MQCGIKSLFSFPTLLSVAATDFRGWTAPYLFFNGVLGVSQLAPDALQGEGCRGGEGAVPGRNRESHQAGVTMFYAELFARFSVEFLI